MRRCLLCVPVELSAEGSEPVLLGFVGALSDYIAIRAELEHIVFDAMQLFQ